MGKAELAIDRLSLRLSGLSKRDGERLARLVAEGLGTANFSGRGPRRLETMKVNIQADAGGDVDRLSKQIVSEILRELATTI